MMDFALKMMDFCTENDVCLQVAASRYNHTGSGFPDVSAQGVNFAVREIDHEFCMMELVAPGLLR